MRQGMDAMALVLEAHHMSHSDWDDREISVICHCGVEVMGEDNGEEAYTQEEALYAGHLASALNTAGFGDLAAAWDEGHRFTGYEPERGENPYRTDKP